MLSLLLGELEYDYCGKASLYCVFPRVSSRKGRAFINQWYIICSISLRKWTVRVVDKYVLFFATKGLISSLPDPYKLYNRSTYQTISSIKRDLFTWRGRLSLAVLRPINGNSLCFERWAFDLWKKEGELAECTSERRASGMLKIVSVSEGCSRNRCCRHIRCWRKLRKVRAW